MTKEEVEALSKGIAEGIRPRLAALEERLKALEESMESAKKSMNGRGIRYRGVYQPSEFYDPGDLATHDGGLWHCHQKTVSRPGTPDSGWQLAVKSGR